MGHIECDHSAKGISAHENRHISFQHVGEFAGSCQVEPLGFSAIVFATGVAAPAKVGCDRVTIEGERRQLKGSHHMIVAISAVQRVRVTDHERGARSGSVGAHDVGLDVHTIDRLQRNGFGPHSHDGTVPCVQTETQRLPIKMLNDRLLVRIPHGEGERRSSGGIVIPATAQISKRLVWAEVVALGANVRAAETGDQVLFSPDDRYEVEVGGIDYIMLRERDLHAVAAPRNEASTGLYL